MSLMNDALRKKKKEKKHLSGTEFLKTDSGRTPKNKVRRYGIAALVLLFGAAAGFYLYEMMSLSRTITPAMPPPFMAERNGNPSGALVSSDPDNTRPASSEPGPSMDQLSQEPPSLSGAGAVEPDSPAPESETPKATPASAPPSAVKQPPPARKQQPRPPAMASPSPVIEPEEAGPRPEPAGNSDLDQAGDVSAAVTMGTDPVEELFYRKGLSYHRQNRLEPAIQMYQAVLKKNPHHRSSRFNLAAAYIRLSAFTEARTILEELNRQKPENPEILLNLAVVEIGLDRPEQALIFLESAEKEIAAPTFETLFHKGAAHSRMGNYETAIALYRKAEKLAPENHRLQLNTAIVLDKLAQYDQAIDYYQMFLKGSTSPTKAEQREIETRVRELKAYLARQANPQTEAGQAE